ncbi:hypothetical protein [Thalassolituus oleivorans]|uniref:hypothetical protein n=1 Tax=Thalassolituus oleivorans TaxID=187493 RepID=UPI0012DE47F6|nr:hypothetical protein [Thalassolituus oleivorans]
MSKQDWCDCCFAHDLAYWRGGTEEERLAADQTFKACILEMTQDKPLAELMYRGVRIGGSAYFPTWYRWGYGWNYRSARGRSYQPLSTEQSAQADVLQRQYFDSDNQAVCR